MIIKRGRLPSTPHTEYYALNGILSLEEIHGSYGFSGPFSRKMHLRHYPTEQSKPPKLIKNRLSSWKPAPAAALQPIHMETGRMPFGGDAISARKTLLTGPNTEVSISKPNQSMAENTFFRNGKRHEAYFVQNGGGVLETEYGRLAIRKGLYLIIPKGTTYRIKLEGKNACFLIIESTMPIVFPPQYLNVDGQAKLMAPIVETEIEAPHLESPKDLKGEYFVDIKHGNGLVTRLTLAHHPFDVTGWEGALFPFAFDIKNHHGIAREIHTAPPIHQTFQSGNAPYNGFSICSFVPQMEGWHPKDVPAPYAHYNVDSDEVMFFSNAHYGARKGIISEGSLTFHPGSLPHSPQGKAALRSLAQRGKISDRLAVMIDTFFESLALTAEGYRWRDQNYALSWHKAALAQDGQMVEALHGT